MASRTLTRSLTDVAARLLGEWGAGVSAAAVIPPDTESAAAALSTETATVFGTSGNNYYSTSATIPAGNWTLGFWCKSTTTGVIYNSGPTGSPHTSNNNLTIHRSVEGLTVTGKDSVGAVLGVSSSSGASSSARGLASRRSLTAGLAVFVCVRKVGSLIQIWLKWPGHAAVKVGEEFTAFGACTAQGLRIAKDRAGSFTWTGSLRRLFFVSYALTDAQIDAVAEGTDPTTLGTPSATDFFFPTMTGGSNWNSSINSIVAAPFLTGWASVTGLGNAPLAEGVYLSPDHDGRVLQRAANARATVQLSGMYFGVDAPIQLLPIDWATGVSVGNWTTVDAAPVGGVWSGSLSLPSRAGWYKFQARKVIAGVPSTQVMTSDLRIGVGEVVMLLGQSLMVDIGAATGNAGASDITASGLWSISAASAPLVGGVGQELVTVTGATNVGGLIQISTAAIAHGRRTGQRVRIVSVAGCVEANAEWIITVTSTTTFTLDGSTFVNAYTSGGFCYFVQAIIRVANNTTQTVPAATAILANYLSSQAACPVEIINRAVGDTAIEAFSSYTFAAGVGGRGALAVLHAKLAETVGTVAWLHGHANIGDQGYHSSGGAAGAWTGYGLLGSMYDFLTAQFPNADFRLGVAAFTSLGGQCFASASNVHQFRHGMENWVTRKRAAGDSRPYFLGYFGDEQPVWENAILMNSHHTPPTYKRFGARIGHSIANNLAAVANSATGPQITSASRVGAVITLAVTHNGGTALKVLRTGARPSGFAVSADGFATLLSISDITFTAAAVVITLASDPGGAVAVRYQYGYVGNYTTGAYFTPRVTGAADNGAGLIRITCSTTAAAVTPNGSQAVGGHGLVTGQWVLIKGVLGTIEANSIWQITVIDSESFDLDGSAFVNAFVAGSLYYAAATGTVVRELGVPIYDDRTIGGTDTNGAPLIPTYTPVVAA